MLMDKFLFRKEVIYKEQNQKHCDKSQSDKEQN